MYEGSTKEREEKKMSAFRKSIHNGFLARAFAALGAANAVSAAVEGGRKPRARDLQELGIDPVSFGRVIR